MILIGTPCRGSVCTETVRSLMDLQQTYRDCYWLSHETTYIDQARQHLATYFLSQKQHASSHPLYTHLLFVDSDMTFPSDTLNDFLELDVPIVAANYRRRRFPHTFTAEDVLGPIDEMSRSSLYSRRSVATTIGLGLCLIRRDVFLRLGPAPFFNRGNPLEGEDTAFSHRCTDAGIPIAVDHQVSANTGHIGTVTYYPGTRAGI